MAVKRYQSSYTGPEIDEAVGRALGPDDTPVSAHTDKLITSGAVADGLDQKAPKAHAASGTTYGVGNASLYGHVRLSDSADSTKGVSSGYAATPMALEAIATGLTAQIPGPAALAPKMDGSSAVIGTQTRYAREDHVHPADPSKLTTYSKGENMLTNWYMCLFNGFPIVHRDEISNPFEGDGFPFDRWYLSCYEAGGTATPTTWGTCLRTTNGHNAFLSQRLPSARSYYDQNYLTCSVLLDVQGSTAHTKKLITISGRIDTYSEPGTYAMSTQSSPVDNYFIGVYYATWTDLEFRIITTNTSANVKVVAAKLELGQAQTLAYNSGTESNPVWVLADAVPSYEDEALRCLIAQEKQSNFDAYANKVAVTNFAVADVEQGETTSRSHNIGDYFMHGGKMYRVKTNMSTGASITSGANCVEYPIENSMKRFRSYDLIGSTSQSFTAVAGVGYLICADVILGSTHMFQMRYLFYNGNSPHLVDVVNDEPSISNYFVITCEQNGTKAVTFHTNTYGGQTADAHVFVITLE